MRVCMYIYMCVCVCVRKIPSCMHPFFWGLFFLYTHMMYVCMHVCMHAYMYQISAHKKLFLSILPFNLIFLDTSMNLCMHVCICVCVRCLLAYVRFTALCTYKIVPVISALHLDILGSSYMQIWLYKWCMHRHIHECAYWTHVKGYPNGFAVLFELGQILTHFEHNSFLQSKFLSCCLLRDQLRVCMYVCMYVRT